jgi:hypothetical protein
MSKEAIAALVNVAIPLLAGLWCYYLSVRLARRPPGEDAKQDQAKTLTKIKVLRFSGVILVVVGLVYAAAAVLRPKVPEAAAWRTVVAADGHSSADMPGEPRKEDKPVDGVVIQGLVVETHGGRCWYCLTTADIPEELRGRTDEEVLQRMKEDLRASSGGAAFAGGGPAAGAYAEWKADGRARKVKVYVAGGRIYRAVADIPDEKDFGADSERFIRSFKLLAKKD